MCINVPSINVPSSLHSLHYNYCDQGCKRDGILRDFSGRDWDFSDSGTGKKRDKTGSRDFLILLKIISDKGIIKQTDEIVGY